jgi:hypothetical protein
MYIVEHALGEPGKVSTESETIGEFQTEAELRAFLQANKDNERFGQWMVMGDASTIHPSGLAVCPPASAFLD